MNNEEIAIIREAQAGSLVAFEALVRRYDRQVLRLAHAMLNNFEDAEDIYQEVFVKIYEKLGRFNFRSEFSTWLYRVAANHCLNYRKKRGRIPGSNQGEQTEADPGWRMVPATGAATPEDALLNDELSQQIECAMNTLPERQRLVFVLRHFHGKKLKEIAGILQCSEGTVKNTLFRATRKMQDALAEYAGR